MKRILIGDQREELMSTLEVILKNWGYRALATSDGDEFKSLLGELTPDLILSSPSFLARHSLQKPIEQMKTPLLLIRDTDDQAEVKSGGCTLAYPVDVFKLFELIQKNMEKVPRRNIRLKVQLPSMYYHGESPCIAEVVSLSAEGLFLKTGARFEGLTDVRIVLPLIGMQTEIEVSGRIVYRVDPHPDNNYRQGMGIEFHSTTEETNLLLQRFVENLLMNELTEKSYTQDALDLDQLMNHSTDLTLKISPAK